MFVCLCISMPVCTHVLVCLHTCASMFVSVNTLYICMSLNVSMSVFMCLCLYLHVGTFGGVDVHYVCVYMCVCLCVYVGELSPAWKNYGALGPNRNDRGTLSKSLPPETSVGEIHASVQDAHRASPMHNPGCWPLTRDQCLRAQAASWRC